MARRILFLASAALAAVAAGPVWPADGDIPYYKARPAERRALLRECWKDSARADTRECVNARAAEAGQLGRPLGPAPYDPWSRYFYPEQPPQRPAAPVRPVGRNPARGT